MSTALRSAFAKSLTGAEERCNTPALGVGYAYSEEYKEGVEFLNQDPLEELRRLEDRL